MAAPLAAEGSSETALEGALKEGRPFVVVVDDEPAMLDSLVELFRMREYPVVGFTEGSAAFKFLCQHRSACLLVTDMMMPGMSGEELIAQVRHERGDRYDQVLAHTGYSATEVPSFMAGVDGFVAKSGVSKGVEDILFLFWSRVESHWSVLGALNERDSAIRERDKALEGLACANVRLQGLNRKLRAANRRMATDLLTGFWLRRTGIPQVRSSFNRCVRGAKPAAVLMIDLDRFKAINDTYGHPFGDEVLRRWAKRMKRVFRQSDDIVVRYGGEEVLLFMPECSLDVAIERAEEIRHAVAATPFRFENARFRAVKSIRLSVSIGVAATDPSASLCLEGLIDAADAALYVAKGQGRNRVSAASGHLGCKP
jgi:two-component system cell cycle response regulator